MGIVWTVLSGFFLVYIIFYLATNYDALEDWIKILYFIFIPFTLIGLVRGIRDYNKKKNALKPICEYCGYVALDERELHNHQLTCEKRV